MSRPSLGPMMYVRRVVDDFPGAFAFYRRFMAPDGTATDGTLVFGVDDVDAAVEELRRAGAQVVVEPHEHEEWSTRFAQVRDPSGRLVEVSLTRGSWGTLLTESP